LIHCSENKEEALRETEIWFHEDELMEYGTAHERVLYDTSAGGHWKH